MFARMLANYDRIVAMGTEDDYEDLLRVLDDMSVREYQILLLLRDFEERAKAEPVTETDTTNPDGAMLLRASKFWEDFRVTVERTGVSQHEIRGSLARLRRTGMYDTFAGHWGDDGEKSRTTPLLDRFLAAVERHESQYPPKASAREMYDDMKSTPQERSRQAVPSIEQVDEDVEALIATLNRHSDEIMQGRVFTEDSAQTIRAMREERDAGMAPA
jgi:hypothetical protein